MLFATIEGAIISDQLGYRDRERQIFGILPGRLVGMHIAKDSHSIIIVFKKAAYIKTLFFFWQNIVAAEGSKLMPTRAHYPPSMPRQLESRDSVFKTIMAIGKRGFELMQGDGG